MITPESIQITLDTLQPAREPPPQPRNRLCVCISDVHFTDGTVGTQNAEDSAWKDFFDDLTANCKDNAVEELTLLLVGDVVDMIRTAEWAKSGTSDKPAVYPWNRDNAGFPLVLRKIMQGIIDKHVRPEGSENAAKGEYGFFHHLQQFRTRLPQVQSEVVVLLGNHDKEILADETTLRMFYEQCLAQPVAQIPESYRRWIGRMYGDEARFLDQNTVPWLPFYWGDTDMRLFVTHGQWRDSDNCRSMQATDGADGWNVKDGWRADAWQKLAYRPFTEPCFGDTVAAGVLSTFIYRAKQALSTYHSAQQVQGQVVPNLHRIERILDELDLYRPSSVAVKRILQETRREGTAAPVRDIIESELYRALTAWLGWDFTLQSSPPARRFALQIARLWLLLTGPLRMFRVQLTLVKAILWLLGWIEKLRPLSVYRKDGASIDDLKTFPTAQKPFWEAGFRIHGEGHTHVPLQADADIIDKNGTVQNNLTYINFGTWRDQIIAKESAGYRRRGVGRALYVWKLPGAEPEFRYAAEDVIGWSDRMDNL